MSRGLGRVQLECLRAIEQREMQGERPTTFTVVAEVYQVKPDQDGNRTISEAQYVAAKRALTSLRRKGLIESCRDMRLTPSGAKTDRTIAAEIKVSVSTMRRARELHGQQHANPERCCLWNVLPAGLEVLRNRVREQTAAAPARRLAA